jgi:hypothetical protein
MAKFGFDASSVEVNKPVSRDPLPEGEYTLKCVESDTKETASGGTMIAAKFEVVKGPYAGRFLWNNFNVVNRSEKAQEIGRRQLVSWAHAAGKPGSNDTDQLLERPFNAVVGVEKGTGGYSDRNNIRSYLIPTESAKPASRVVEDAPKPAAPPAGPKSKQPWDD